MRGIGLAAIVFITPAGVLAAPKEPVRIDYMLPATAISAGVEQRITKCPAPAAERVMIGDDTSEGLRAEFEWKVRLQPSQAPHRLVSLNTESGFLVDRETKVHFADDWYLKDFNGKTTGQGGALMVSLVKAGAAVAAMAANPIVGLGTAALAAQQSAGAEGFVKTNAPAKQTRYYRKEFYVVCKDDVADRLASLKAARADIAALETRVIAGDVSVPTQDLLTRRREMAADLERRLTITITADKALVPMRVGKNVTGLSTRITAVDISPWFEVQSIVREVTSSARAGTGAQIDLRSYLASQQFPGIHGYQVEIAVNDTIERHFGCAGAGTPAKVAACEEDIAAVTPIATRNLIYKRPIPAVAKIYPFASPCAPGSTCPADPNWVDGKKATGTVPVKLPQLSRNFEMRTGGSIFGGRTVGAEFGAMSEPTMLQYNIGSSGKDVAGLVDASVSAAQTIRDADNAAIKRRLEAEKTRGELEALLEKMAAEALP